MNVCSDVLNTNETINDHTNTHPHTYTHTHIHTHTHSHIWYNFQMWWICPWSTSAIQVTRRLRSAYVPPTFHLQCTWSTGHKHEHKHNKVNRTQTLKKSKQSRIRSIGLTGFDLTGFDLTGFDLAHRCSSSKHKHEHKPDKCLLRCWKHKQNNKWSQLPSHPHSHSHSHSHSLTHLKAIFECDEYAPDRLPPFNLRAVYVPHTFRLRSTCGVHGQLDTNTAQTQ